MRTALYLCQRRRSYRVVKRPLDIYINADVDAKRHHLTSASAAHLSLDNCVDVDVDAYAERHHSIITSTLT